MENCFICSKHAGMIQTSGGKIYEDEFVYVGHIDKQGKLNYLGHVMIDLKRHAPDPWGHVKRRGKSFWVYHGKNQQIPYGVGTSEHVYSLVSGNSVPHLHMHLVPRYKNTPEEFWGPMEVYDWADAPMGNSEDVTHLCNRLKQHLEKN